MPHSPNPLRVRELRTVSPSPWQTTIFSSTVMTSLFDSAFSAHGTRLFFLSLQFFLCSSSALGCLASAWSTDRFSRTCMIQHEYPPFQPPFFGGWGGGHDKLAKPSQQKSLRIKDQSCPMLRLFQNQGSELSKATIVPQSDVGAGITRSEDRLNLVPGNAGTCE